MRPLCSVSNALQSRNIQASNLKFGFLGLGMVKNLLNSGHSVVVWNRTATKCRKFQEAGAEVADTPSDVIEMADVTFSCVADPQVAKELVFGNCGVMSANLVGKGYVEMTGVDPETSHDIAEQIISKGGRYLEAQIQGFKNQAEEGTLIILAAGKRLLFEECQTCFEVISRNSFYMGDVGNATKMNLVLQMLAVLPRGWRWPIERVGSSTEGCPGSAGTNKHVVRAGHAEGKCRREMQSSRANSRPSRN